MAAFRSLQSSTRLLSFVNSSSSLSVAASRHLSTRTTTEPQGILRHGWSAGSSLYAHRGAVSLLGPTRQPFPSSPLQGQRRHYTPMTAQEEEEEKQRVSNLTDFAKEQELRKLNREIARLEMLRGINTGELYTWTGKYKALARDYGFPLVAWYWSCWGLTAVACWAAIELGGIDAMALVAKADAYTGWELTSRLDPNLGKLGLVLVVNELIEPVRLPLVIVTVKPVMDQLFPPKY